MKIAIRLGHTILKNGQCTASSGIGSEYKMIREYAPLVAKYLQQLGHEVLNVTPMDKNFDNEIADINAGIKAANDAKADLFVSLHVNCSDGAGHGCEVLHGSAKGNTVATNICLELAKLGFKNRGAKADVRGLNEIKRTAMTSVIVEPLFCDNAADMKLYNADKLARAIVKGITGKEVGVPTTSKAKTKYCLEFQKWYNKVTQTSKPLTEDGVYGQETEKAYQTMNKLIRGEY